ncbi:MAG TPA: hypothetical protein PK165_05235 [bacterium]|nr:hypothetical protein [bacterium]HOL50424.1 hypothetical protein [bacterium]HPO52215.1 hypothetical protein [bacterium]HXK45089.1 hypothetical protein [bacterium]
MKRILLMILPVLFFICSGQARDKLYVEVQKEDVLIATESALYNVSADGIYSAGYIMYFGAKDFTANKDLTVKKLKEAKVVVDKPDRKVVKAVFLVEPEWYH